MLLLLLAGMSREDAMALSRLYAVQLLAGLCQDFMAAARWLEAGGAGLSHEQQEVRTQQCGRTDAATLQQWSIQRCMPASATPAYAHIIYRKRRYEIVGC
jgi:hypothetical protein